MQREPARYSFKECLAGFTYLAAYLKLACV